MAQQTVTAFYDSREYANNAALKLRQAGVTDVTVSPAASDTRTYAETSGHEGKGFWASLEDLFGGSDDHASYAEGLRRGGTMLVAHVDDAKLDGAIDILNEHGSVDLTERETAWRSEGWSGASQVTGGGVADTGAGPLRSLSPVAEAKPAVAPAMVATPVEDRTVMPAAAPVSRGEADETLQVVEESLSVGKRAVSRGKVRIHSYVVETPVTETVTLRDETVTVDRRPVDRPIDSAALGVDSFRDRTIEMEEVDEEAVVAKSARVVEEVGLRKEVSDRTQTISDTVRSTKVDVEDSRTTGIATTSAGGISGIAEGMDVVGSDGVHLGVIDHIEGTVLKLKKNDPASGGQHHVIPTDWVASVGTKVMLKTTSAEAKTRWSAA